MGSNPLEHTAITACYLEHLRATIEDLRRVRDDLKCELSKTRAQAWQRGLVAAEFQARAETERRNAEHYFEMVVEAEVQLQALRVCRPST